MDYYERKFRSSGKVVRICWYCLIGIVFSILMAFLFSGCKTKGNLENTDTKDSIRTEIIEKVVIDTVYVTVEIPAESKERETRDSTSMLETSMARSTASLTWKDDVPILFHSLENKPQKIGKPVEVAHKEKCRTVYRTRYVTRKLYCKADLTWWQKTRMYAGDALMAAVVVCLAVFLFRKSS